MQQMDGSRVAKCMMSRRAPVRVACATPLVPATTIAALLLASATAVLTQTGGADLL